MMTEAWDVTEIRKDFPFFASTTLAYLDNSATSQRPLAVLDAEREYQIHYNANPFRGLYALSTEATDRYEEARRVVAEFVHATDSKEIIFTRNASESLNLVAYSLSEAILKPGDEILTSVMEHHSNLLPWQQAAKRHGATVKYVHPTSSGGIDLNELKGMLSERTKIVALTHMSNVFGCVNDMKEIAKLVHEYGAYVVCDGAQSVPHITVDVQDLDIDFLAFSGHKMLSPFGIGVLYGKEKILQTMPPFLTGGEMIEHVSLEEVTYASIPHRFEAGTVNAVGAVALAEAIRYYKRVGMERMQAWELELTKYAIEGMKKIPHIQLVGSDKAEEHHGILTFKVERVHPHDVASIFADADIAVRAGHHCAEPLHQYLEIPSTTRASLMFYNTKDEVDRFLETLATIRPLMGFAE